MTFIVTLDMIWSLGLLVPALPTHKETPLDLLKSAGALWITNILVFASWYWRLDGGGPSRRELHGVHVDGAFLFPQMTLTPETGAIMCEQNWHARLRRLPLPRLQYLHRLLPHRRARPLALGQKSS